MLSDIEKRLNFTYPALFHRLNADGMLDWGQLGPNWYDVSYPVLRKHPPLLLFASDFKIIPLGEVEGYCTKLRIDTPTYSHFIPFGKNGAGDLIGFLYRTNNDLESICRFNKRTDICLRLARSLDDYLFRELLGAVVDIDVDELEDDRATFEEDLNSMLASHSAYIDPDRFTILSEIYSRGIHEFDGCVGKLSIDEYQQILTGQIGFDGLGQELGEVSFVP